MSELSEQELQEAAREAGISPMELRHALAEGGVPDRGGRVSLGAVTSRADAKHQPHKGDHPRPRAHRHREHASRR